MRYLGGKSRTRNEIAGYLNWLCAEMAKERGTAVPYWEPFVGAGWVLEKIKGQPIYASDVSLPLVEMWRGLQNGWKPPKSVTRDEYDKAKEGLLEIKQTAFIGYGSTFGGQWFSQYVDKDERSGIAYAKNSHDNLLRKINRMTKKIHFFSADFLTCYVPAYGCLIYCDPPYENTSGYAIAPDFDHALFWQRVRWLENYGHTVVVSEYAAPDDFSCVLEIPTKTAMHTKNGKGRRVERLFRYGQHANVKPKLFNF